MKKTILLAWLLQTRLRHAFRCYILQFQSILVLLPGINPLHPIPITGFIQSLSSTGHAIIQGLLTHIYSKSSAAWQITQIFSCTCAVQRILQGFFNKPSVFCKLGLNNWGCLAARANHKIFRQPLPPCVHLGCLARGRCPSWLNFCLQMELEQTARWLLVAAVRVECWAQQKAAKKQALSWNNPPASNLVSICSKLRVVYLRDQQAYMWPGDHMKASFVTFVLVLKSIYMVLNPFSANQGNLAMVVGCYGRGLLFCRFWLCQNRQNGKILH